MTAFGYRNGRYYAEDVSIKDIADAVGTPFYCYSRADIEERYDAYEKALASFDALICYALKANSNQAIIRLLAERGAGADVVSQGELQRALAAGVTPDKIVFSGVAKTRPEIDLALRTDIRQFNVESEQELEAINDVATGLGKTARVAFRINPDVDAGTHEKISTGKSENKFGIPWNSVRRAYAHAAALPGIEVCGVDLHIGSQITQLEPFSRAFSKIATLIDELRVDGHTISSIDLGGGLGIDYNKATDGAPTPENYAKVVARTLGQSNAHFIVEPGRSLVGNAGVLVGQVIYVKPSTRSTFLIIDAAMNDFLRPSMYDSYHEIVGERQTAGPPIEYDIVGPVCETGDTFARNRRLPEQSGGDLIIIEGAGAYGSVMASSYNTRPLVPEVLVEGDKFRLIRKRPSLASIIELDLA